MGSRAIDIGSRNQILFDRFLIERAEGFSPSLARPRKEGPVLRPDRPWERSIWCWVSVLQEGGTVRLWYDAIGEDGVWRLCYAESRDGLNFTKPNLGLYEYRGSRENNICFVAPKGYHAGSIFLDPSAPSGERYKMVYGGGGPIGDSPYLHISAAVSPDGIRWRHVADSITPWYTDTMNVCFYDLKRRRYMLYVRYWTGKFRYERGRIVGRDFYGKRGVGFSESDDFLRFPKPRLILAPDDLDPPDLHLYNSAARKYPLAERAYLMFPSAYHTGSDLVDVQIAVSRDGARWERPVREAIVPLEGRGEFDSGQIYVGAGTCSVGDEVWLYYGGFEKGHNSIRPLRDTAMIGRLVWLRDRFLGWRTGPDWGELLTKPVTFRGGRLFVNFEAEPGGALLVEILSPDGGPLEGFSLDRCQPLLGGALHAEVKWEGAGRLARLSGRPVRLRFKGRKASLYSFKFSL